MRMHYNESQIHSVLIQKERERIVLAYPLYPLAPLHLDCCSVFWGQRLQSETSVKEISPFVTGIKWGDKISHVWIIFLV